MGTRYAIVDDANTVVHVGPATTFPTKTQALLILLMIPDDRALDWHVLEVDDEFPLIPLPPLPELPA